MTEGKASPEARGEAKGMPRGEGKASPPRQGEGTPRGEARHEGKAAPRPASGRGQQVLTICLGVLAGIIASAGLLAVISAGFSLSFESITEVAKASRINAVLAWLMPISIDGAMAVASVHVVIAKRLGASIAYPLVVVGVGAVISIVCNGLHALGTLNEPLVLSGGWRFGVSAIPAAMTVLSVHLLVEMTDLVDGKARHATPRAAMAQHVEDLESTLAEAEASLTEATERAERAEASLAEALASKAATAAPPAPPRGEGKARTPRAPKTPRQTDELGEARKRHQVTLCKAWANENGRVPKRDEAKKIANVGSVRADEIIAELRAELERESA